MLYCYANQLTALDVSRNTELSILSCFGNQLTELDISQNPYLVQAVTEGRRTEEENNISYELISSDGNAAEELVAGLYVDPMVQIYTAWQPELPEGVIDMQTDRWGITWTLYENGLLAFEGEGMLVNGETGDSGAWREYSDLVQSVSIAEGITSIEGRSFRDFTGLHSVFLASTMESIGESAFYGCDSLEEVTYYGTQETWDEIVVDEGNEPLLNATIHVQGENTTTYVISYDANGGANAPAAQTKTHGESMIITEATPTREGYTFLGWSASRTATQAAYQPGGTYGGNADATLYAVWKQDAVDEDVPQIVVSSTVAAPGSTATVTVSLKNNPGIAGLMLTYSYDKEMLELTGAPVCSGLEGGVWTAGTAKAMWDNTVDVNDDGVIMTLTFKVLENAEGKTPVTVTYESGEISNYNGEDVNFAVQAGIVTVRDFIPGDINGDGNVNPKDVVLLRRYLVEGENVVVQMAAVDVNGDGNINPKDVVLLRRHLVEGIEI